MRILVLTPFLPHPPHDGGRIRILHLLRGLAAHHQVDVLSLAEPGVEQQAALTALRDEGFAVDAVDHRPRAARAAAAALLRRRSFYAARMASPAFATVLADRLATGRYDAVQCEFSYLGQYHRPGIPWVLDAHNVESLLSARIAAGSDLLHRVYAWREAARRRAEEFAACRRMAHVVTTSAVDRDHLQAALPGLPVTVVPNGVDLEHFTPRPDPGGNHAVFVGKMDYRPNVDAMRWFCAEILPLVRASVPEFRLTIVGGHPVPEVRALGALPGVTVTGRVPDTRPLLEQATVVIVPLRAGSGTRLKILEALAMGRPVVTTPIGCEGLRVISGRDLLIADGDEAFAGAVTTLLGDPAERAGLSTRGRWLVAQRYGWTAAADRLARVYDDLPAGTPSPATTVNRSRTR